MSLKDSALAVLQRNHGRNRDATGDENTMQLDAHFQRVTVASNNKLLIPVRYECADIDCIP